MDSAPGQVARQCDERCAECSELLELREQVAALKASLQGVNLLAEAALLRTA